MMVLVTYDVRTEDETGARRLRRVANVCKDFGQRVQNSVFECLVDPAQLVALRQALLDEMDQEEDSVRFYFLGSNWKHRVEHVGAKVAYDPQGPLVV
jgi:CRISPR-associated protein Cas2